jgi:lipid-binding SYLF domain-containing protein
MLAAIVAISAVSVLAQETAPPPAPPQPDAKKLEEARKRADSRLAGCDPNNERGDRSIPRDLMRKASAVVVFPGVLKGAFVVGGQGGKGIVVRRTKDGWSAPAFLKMAGGSFGLQAGGSKIDYVMLVMNDGGLKGLLEDKFEMGGEASVSAGPVGRNAAASTNATLGRADIDLFPK